MSALRVRAKRGKGVSPRENGALDERPRALKILGCLKKDFPRASTALDYGTPFQLLIATILSAQCTDERVNTVTKTLFKKYPTPGQMARAHIAGLEEDVRSTGFYRMKARNIKACSIAIMEQHGGKIPQSMVELVALPGVGRKTANVVLGQAFGITSGVVVDTHVHRLSQRLGFSLADTPERIEEDLMELFPRKYWISLASMLILHGRKTCNARSPKCIECSVQKLCPSAPEFLKNV